MQLVSSKLFFRSYIFVTCLYMCNLFPVLYVCFSASHCNHCYSQFIQVFCLLHSNTVGCLICTQTLAVLSEDFLWSLSVLLTSCQCIPLHRPWLLPSMSFTIHYSLIILSPLYSLRYWLCHCNPLNKLNVNLLWIILNRDFGHFNFHQENLCHDMYETP